MNGSNPGRQSTGRWHQRLHSFKWVKTLWLAIAISGTWTCHGAPVEPNGITTCEKLAVERNSLGRRMSIQRLVIAGTTTKPLLTQQVMSWLHSTIATEATGSNDAARAA